MIRPRFRLVLLRHHRAQLLCAGRHDDPTTVIRGQLCEDCRLRLRSQLARIPDLAHALRVNTSGVTSGGWEPVSGSRERPLPGGQVLALLGPAAPGTVHGTDQTGDIPVPAVLTSWAQLHVAERDWATLPVPTLLGVCTWLRQASDWAADQSWAADYAAEVADCHHRLRQASGDLLDRRKLPDPCPHCDTRALVDQPEHEHARCSERLGGCGRIVTPADLHGRVPAVGEALREAVEEQSA